MLTESRAASIIEKALGYARGKCSGCEVTVSSSDVATSRFANNSMTQNQAPFKTEVSVRVLKGGKQARLTSDNLTPSGITSLVDNALLAGRFLEKDADLLSLPGRSGQSRSVKRFDGKTASLDASKRADSVRQIIDVATTRGLSAAGVVASGSTLFAVGNSKGLFACHRESHAECSITMRKGDATGWSKSQQPRFADLDCAGLALQAADKALANVNPVEIPPGKYTVILEPAAVLDLIGYLWPDFRGTSHLDQLSCFRDKVGQKVFGDNITIVDDVYHQLQTGAAFDGEGLPRQAVTLVKNGVIADMVCGRRSAKKLGRKPTGHGLAEPNGEGEAAVNIVIAGGNTPLADMIAASEKAVLLTRVWYVRQVDPTSKIVTGMTRDGTFLVENGAVTKAVKNLRFNQGLIEMLNSVLALGPAVRTAGEESFPAVVPAMKVANFNFASTTTF